MLEIIWSYLAKFLHPQMAAVPGPTDFVNASEQQSKAHAIRTLKSALNELLLWVKHTSPASQLEIDTELRKNNLPLIAELTSQHQKTIQKILKRGRITSQAEYYLLKEYLMASENDLSESHRSQLFQYLEEFELKP